MVLEDLYAPETGHLDVHRVAEYLQVPLKGFTDALNKNDSTIRKTLAAPYRPPALCSIKRILEILEQVFVDRSVVLAWLNSPHPDLGQRTALEVILQGYPDVVEDMLEAALEGIPS